MPAIIKLKLLKIAILFFTTLAGELSGHGLGRLSRRSSRKDVIVAIAIFSTGFFLALLLTWFEETHNVTF